MSHHAQLPCVTRARRAFPDAETSRQCVGCAMAWVQTGASLPNVAAPRHTTIYAPTRVAAASEDATLLSVMRGDVPATR